MSDEVLLARYLLWLLVERGLLSSTIKAYERELKALAAGTEGSLEQLDSAGIRDHLHKLGGASASVARRLATYKSFYGYLVRSGVRADDPTLPLDRPKVRRGLPRPLDDPDAAFSSLDEESRLIATFLRETGLRISEACSVRCTVPVPDVLLVVGKGQKERLVPLTQAARSALDGLGGSMPVGKRAIQRRFEKAGFTPHRLRHTFGCELAASDADLGVIQDLLGHASPATTRVYTQYSLNRLRTALDRRSA